MLSMPTVLELPPPPSTSIDVSPLDDAQLVGEFLDHRDEGAFEAIVRRHGPMVLGVCRRVTGNTADADDAFQATFLVLARKAKSVKPAGMLGHWLWGVAYRSALKARTVAGRRREHERRAASMKPEGHHPVEPTADLRPVLDEELNGLSGRYRAAIIACDLEGKSRESAARDLGINPGTLSSRLNRGRGMLARRLARRGVAVSAAALSSALASQAATAGTIPAGTLIGTTVQASLAAASGGSLAAGAVSAKAAVLTEGVLHAMYISKIKFVATVGLSVLLAGTGAGVVHQIAFADKPKAVAKEAPAGGKSDKAGWTRPDVSGSVVAVVEEGKRVTLQTSKGTKERAPDEVRINTEGADVTFSAIGPLEDRVAEGYQANIWLQPGSTDKAAKVRYSGHQSFKALSRSPDIEGQVASMTADGKRLLIEGRGSKEKGVEAPQIEVNLTPATDLRFNGVKTGGAKVEQGYEAQIWLDETRENAAIARLSATDGTVKKAAAANPPDLSGEIAEAGADGKSFTIGGASKEKGAPPERTEVRIEQGTKVIYMGVPEDGTKPKEGYRADVWMDGNVAKTIRIDANPRPKAPDIVSRVLAVAADGKTITVGLKPKTKGEEPGQKEIEIGSAKIMFNNVRAGQAKPAVGDETQVWLDAQNPAAAARATFARDK
jgi:RNA polymerase sigma factor (sigma-70 family)